MNLGGKARKLAVGACLAAVPLAGCGSDEPDHPIVDAVHELQDAFVAGDVERICTRITEAARGQAGQMAHGDPRDCRRDVLRAFRIIANGGGWEASPPPRVTEVAAGPRRGTATVTVGDWSADVAFAKVDGRWKLDGFFGTSLRDKERAAAAALAAPQPARGEDAVLVEKPGGGACPPLRRDSSLTVSGGCSFGIFEPETPFYVLTPFGPFKFGDCSLTYEVRVDSRGRAWTEPLNSRGKDPDSGCADVRSCLGPQRVPWNGSLRRDGSGGYLHRMTVCLDTCVGVYAGTMTMRLSKQGRRWKAEAVRGEGESGFWFAGQLVVDGVPRVTAAT